MIEKIDAVITWVNGDDPVHMAKRAKYGNRKLFAAEDIAGKSRYSSVGEIYWCVASINRFAPFINKIYIVTDQQDPNLRPFLELNFPNGYIPFQIIDHKEIFEGYHQYLPTFNSVTIETMTWRIPGLSNHFIEFNDDMLLWGPTTPEDFFTKEGKPICYATKAVTVLSEFTRKLKAKKNNIPQVTFKGLMINAVKLAGGSFIYYRLDHAPRGLLRDFYKEYYTKNPQNIERNIQYKFRDIAQYTPQELQYLTLIKQGKAKYLNTRNYLFVLKPKKQGKYISDKINKLKNGNYMFCCFNALDMACTEDLKLITDTIENKLQIKSINDER